MPHCRVAHTQRERWRGCGSGTVGGATVAHQAHARVCTQQPPGPTRCYGSVRIGESGAKPRTATATHTQGYQVRGEMGYGRWETGERRRRGAKTYIAPAQSTASTSPPLSIARVSPVSRCTMEIVPFAASRVTSHSVVTEQLQHKATRPKKERRTSAVRHQTTGLAVQQCVVARERNALRHTSPLSASSALRRGAVRVAVVVAPGSIPIGPPRLTRRAQATTRRRRLPAAAARRRCRRVRSRDVCIVHCLRHCRHRSPRPTYSAVVGAPASDQCRSLDHNASLQEHRAPQAVPLTNVPSLHRRTVASCAPRQARRDGTQRGRLAAPHLLRQLLPFTPLPPFLQRASGRWPPRTCGCCFSVLAVLWRMALTWRCPALTPHRTRRRRDVAHLTCVWVRCWPTHCTALPCSAVVRACLGRLAACTVGPSLASSAVVCEASSVASFTRLARSPTPWPSATTARR
jgi:hypothetical protein